MGEKRLDDLLNTLGLIAHYKSLIPLGLRGWVSALGLYVQEREAGQWTRLQAGGSLRSYLDAWREGEGEWDVRKFDIETWERRFASVLDPTYNIANYLLHYSDFAQPRGIVYEKLAILSEAIEHYKATQEWLWLPGVPVSSEGISQMARLEPRKLDAVISYAESLREGSKESCDWQFLAMLYDLAARYKDMENAIKTVCDLVCSGYKGSEWMVWGLRQAVGIFYFAAFSNSTRREEVIVLGSIRSKVTAESLGYTADEARALAEENLRSALADAKRKVAEGFHVESSELKQLEDTLAACKSR